MMALPVMDRAICPQACRPIRLHGSGNARRAASGKATGRAERGLNAALIGAEHRGDVLNLVAVATKQPGGFLLGCVKALADNVQTVQRNTRFRVTECGHGVSSMWSLWGCRSCSAAASLGGESVARFAPTPNLASRSHLFHCLQRFSRLLTQHVDCLLSKRRSA